MNCIYFYTPDILRPVGGIGVIYSFVSILNELEYKAFVLHNEKDFINNFYTINNIYIKYIENNIKIFDNDILIIPEENISLLLSNKFFSSLNCKKVIFCQGWSNIGNSFFQVNKVFKSFSNKLIRRYQDLGIFNVITIGYKNSEFIDYCMNYDNSLNIHSLDLFIDKDIFQFTPLEEKKIQIAYMSRKNKQVFERINSIFLHRNKNINFVEIDNLKPFEVAEIMKNSAIFLSLGYPEGFSLPPLEAMSCGELVIGYSGQGGLNYMRDNYNMFLFPDGEVFFLSKKLEEIINDLNSKKYYKYTDIINNANLTSKKYNKENSTKKLELFIKTLINQ